MQVKIDTKERFFVVSPVVDLFTATMAAELSQKLMPYLQRDVKSSDTPANIVLKMTEVSSLELSAAKELLNLQQRFYEHHCSFVICELNKSIEAALEKEELLELMNCTPTESEAWDIVQMEEIERELLDNEFSDN